MSRARPAGGRELRVQLTADGGHPGRIHVGMRGPDDDWHVVPYMED